MALSDKSNRKVSLRTRRAWTTNAMRILNITEGSRLDRFSNESTLDIPRASRNS